MEFNILKYIFNTGYKRIVIQNFIFFLKAVLRSLYRNIKILHQDIGKTII